MFSISDLLDLYFMYVEPTDDLLTSTGTYFKVVYSVHF